MRCFHESFLTFTILNNQIQFEGAATTADGNGLAIAYLTHSDVCTCDVYFKHVHSTCVYRAFLNMEIRCLHYSSRRQVENIVHAI